MEAYLVIVCGSHANWLYHAYASWIGYFFHPKNFKQMQKFTISSDKKDVAKKVFESFENETLKELGEKVIGGVCFEASWGKGTKPPKTKEPE